MTSNVRLPLIALGVVVLVGFGGSRPIRVDGLRPKLQSGLSAALGRQVKVGELSLSLFAGKISAHNISIADDPAFSNDAFVTAKSLSAAVDLTPLLLSRILYITGITLEEPQIRLIRGPGGTWNFSSIGRDTAGTKPSEDKSEVRVSTSSPASLVVDKLAVEKGRVVVGFANSAEQPAAYENVNLEATNFSSNTQFLFELYAGLPGGGDLNLKGQCGPINAGDMAATPLDASLQIRNLEMTASRLVLPGTEMDSQMDQEVKTRRTLTAENLDLPAKGTPSAASKLIAQRSSDWNVIRKYPSQTLPARHAKSKKVYINLGTEDIASLFLLRRYLQDTKWARRSTSAEEMKEFQSYVRYFKKYAAQYHFDYLMLVAQAYQESRLDQNRISPVGAVGIMQVIPKFAAAPPINIPDVLTPEANIHAGIKMLRHFDQTYFRNKGIDPMNKALLTFASYNAGPSRIARLRRQAKREGLDPNQWFDNVELVVAREVGQETVQYVNNIYKHYVGYKLALEHRYGIYIPNWPSQDDVLDLSGSR